LIWDIEGGTPSKPVNSTYLIGAHGCILVADITREETIENIANYIDIVRKTSPKAVFVLVLNKCDMLDDVQKQALYENTCEVYQKSVETVYLTSAKTGEQVETMFTALAKLLSHKG
jgi:GTPase SAR1 family protein